MLNNTVFLRGNLAQEPELTYTSSGKALCKFVIAVNRMKQKDGEQKTDFIRITCWETTAEYVGKYIQKGYPVHVGGSIQIEKYEFEGKAKYTTNIVAYEVNSLQKRDLTKTSDIEDVFGLDSEDVPF